MAIGHFMPQDLANGFQPYGNHLYLEDDDDYDDDDDDDDGITMSAVSSADRTAWASMRQFLPLPYAADTDWSGMSESWQHLQDQRNQARKYHRDLAGLKSLMKQKKREKADADRALHLLALSCSKEDRHLPRQTLLELYNRIKKLEDTCATLENQYDELGAKMHREHAKLEAHETVFFKRLASEAADSHAGTSRAGHKSTAEDSELTLQHQTTMDTVLLGISGQRPRVEHPMYRQLLQAVGDLRLAREGRDELRVERDEIIEDLKARIVLERNRRHEAYDLETLQAALETDYCSDAFRDAFSSYLDAEDMHFLCTWHDVGRAAEADVVANEERVRQMRSWCETLGALPAYMPSDEQDEVLGAVLDLEQQATALGMDMDAAYGHTLSSRSWRDVLAHPTFPRLLTNPYHLLASPPVTAKVAVARALRLQLPDDHPDKQAAKEDSIKEYGIESTLTRCAPGNKADFINRWLLQQLRTSCLAVLCLFDVMSDTLGVVNLARWQDDVVYYWSLDDANRRTSSVYSSMSDSDARPGTEASLPLLPSEPFGVERRRTGLHDS